MAEYTEEKSDDSLFAAVKVESDCYEKDAIQEKQLFQPNFDEAYSFMMPYRVRPSNTTGTTRPQDASENFTTLGEEVTTDFASDMADTFTPEHAQWAGIEVSSAVPEEIDADELEKAIAKEQSIIFDAITSSNFHESCKQGNKDLGVSAFGLAIEKAGPGEPDHCQVIPLTELLILRAPSGGLGFRAWSRKLKARDVKATFPHLAGKFTERLKLALTKPADRTKFPVIQGCYRDYSVPAEYAWMIYTKIDGKVLESSRKIGVGSANILVCRWDPDPMFAWGIGCGIKALGDFRELDETAYLKLKGMARIIDPPVGYTDDSVINLEGGLPNGVAIPMLEGSKIEVIESEHSVEAVLFATKDPEDRVRRHFYLDEPKQPGKTPPTAYQWQDEALRRQRRLGTPAAPIWPEFLSEAFMRFRYLLVQRGTLQNGLPVGKAMLPISPMNPLKRAAQQEEAMATERSLTTLGNLFGQPLLPVIVDVGETCHRYVKLGHAKGVQLRPAKEINATIDQMRKAEMAGMAAKAAAPLAGAMGGAQ